MSDVELIDDVISAIGFGRWQVPILLTTLLANILPVNLIAATLLSAPLPFRCSVPEYEHNMTTFVNTSISTNIHSSVATPQGLWDYNSECLAPMDLPTMLEMPQSNSSPIVRFSVLKRRTEVPSCPEIDYDQSVFTSTVISEFDLVCEKESLRPLFQVIMTMGNILGSLVGGQIADSLGRKRSIQIGALIGLPACLVVAFAPWYAVVVSMRMFIGFATRTALLPSTSLCMETIPRRYRTIVGMFTGIPYSLFIIVLAGSGYMVKEWRLLQLVCTGPFIFILPLSLLIDESPRWLVQRSRGKEAVKLLEKASLRNNNLIYPTFASLLNKLKMENQVSDPNRRLLHGFDIRHHFQEVQKHFRSRAMLIILLVSPAIWFLQSIIYIGITFNVNNFSSTNPFLFIALEGVFEIVAIMLSTPLTHKIGRKLVIGWEYFIGGSLLLAEIAIPAEIYWCKWLMMLLAFFLISGAFQINYLYVPELFPTSIRTRGFALATFAGSIGLMVAPFITDLLIKEAWWAPSLALGMAGILASFLQPLLPETNNLPLPENIQDVEDRWRRSRGKLTANELDLQQEVKNKTTV